MAVLHLERGKLQPDGYVLMNDVSRWIEADYFQVDLEWTATKWAMRGPEYMASVLMKDAYGKYVPALIVQGRPEGRTKDYRSEFWDRMEP